MVTANDIAKFYIHLAAEMADAEAGEYMTNLKLQKLLYFTQGEYMAAKGKPLFSGEFEAWQFGPVMAPVYQQYRKYGANPIPDEYEDCLPDEIKQFLMDVEKAYGSFSAAGLVGLSHEKGSPWKETYVPGQNVLISNDLMKTYFQSYHRVKPFSETVDRLRSLAKQLPRDADGIITISDPKDDPWRSEDV